MRRTLKSRITDTLIIIIIIIIIFTLYDNYSDILMNTQVRRSIDLKRKNRALVIN